MSLRALRVKISDRTFGGRVAPAPLQNALNHLCANMFQPCQTDVISVIMRFAENASGIRLIR